MKHNLIHLHHRQSVCFTLNAPFLNRIHISIKRFDVHKYCKCVVQVCDTHEFSTSIRTSLEKVMSLKFISRSRCYSTKVRSVFVLVSGSI